MKLLTAAIASAALLLGGLAAMGALAVKRLPHSTKTLAAQQNAPKYYANNLRAMRLAQRIAANNQLDEAWVRRVIGAARFSAPIQKLVLPPTHNGSRKNWSAYRARFVEPVRVRAGVQFWNAHSAALARAESEFGVPASVIVGVLGMETMWGQQTGQIRVLDALATLAIDFPASHPRAAARSEYFTQELEQFLVLMHQNQTDPRTPRGSYAGDMGMPQFMPSSWARYGVDFNNDGRIDLWNADDAIGSVANYLRAHGWIAGQPVFCKASLSEHATALAELTKEGLTPLHDLPALRQYGVEIQPDCSAQIAESTPLALVELEDGNHPSVWMVATGNLRTITRYNPSRYYAMAVTELGTAIAQAHSTTTR